MCARSLQSCLFLTIWTAAHQAPLSMGILQARILKWIAMPSSRGSSWPRDWTQVSYISCIGKWVLYHLCHLGSLKPVCVCVCVCVCVHIYIPFHIIFHYDLSQDIACNSPCCTVQRLRYLSVILIQKGPLGLSVHCCWFTSMKQLNVPLHSLYFSMFG